MNSNNNNMNNNNNINNNNNRPNLNYNYTYTLSPNNSSNNKHKQLYNNNNSITKPHSTTYITSTTKPLYQLQQQQHLNNNNNRHPQSYTQYHPRKPLSTNIMGMKYYPIINDDQQDVMYNNNKVDYNISNNRELSRKLSQTQSGTLSSFYVNNRERNINNNNNSNLLFIQTNNTVISGKQHQQQQRQQQYQQHQQLQHQQQQQQPTQHIQKYLIWLYQAFGQFEKTGNVRILKDINQKNKNQVVRLIDLVYNEKEKHRERGEQYHYCDGHVDNNNNNRTQPKTIQRNINNNNNINTTSTQQIFKIKQQIFNLNKQSTTIQQQLKLQYQISNQLQQQLIQQIQIKQGHNLNQSQIRQQNHLNQMQQSIKQLQQEIKTIERKNLQLWKNINNVPFLKEWSLMFDEAKGATKLAVRLKHQIMKKEQLIKQLTNQDPSNNSDARSMKRAGSENGDRPQSKFTKNSNNKVFNYTNNSSNLNTDPAPIPKPSTPLRLSSQLSYKQSQKPQSGRSSNDVIIRHLSHSNRFSQSKKSNNISNSVERTKQRKQSYDQKQYSKNEPVQWKGLAFPSNLKSYGVGFIGKDAYK